MYLEIQPGVSVLKQVREQAAAEQAAMVKDQREFRESIIPLLRRLQGLPSWGDVRAVSHYKRFLSLFLYRDRKDSPLPREIAQEFHATGRREAGDGDLQVSFSLKDGSAITVLGYLPATCRVERVREYIPAHEGWVNKVVCTGGPDEGSSAEEEVPF